MIAIPDALQTAKRAERRAYRHQLTNAPHILSVVRYVDTCAVAELAECRNGEWLVVRWVVVGVSESAARAVVEVGK